MNSTDNYITKEKREELEKELIDLKGQKRREIIAALEYAKSLGDLSENAEYHQAREDQAKLEERISKIEEILKSSQTISHDGGDTVTVGSTVTVDKLDKNGSAVEQRVYMIVGSEEADMQNGKISNKSPFGVALYGKKKGETISFQTPNGVVNYKIIKVA